MNFADKDNLESFFSWARYLHWTNMFRCRFDEWYNKPHDLSKPADSMEFFSLVSHWLSSLWVAIEGWRELKTKDQVIDSLINEWGQYCKLLKRYRNGVYHFQSDLFNERFVSFSQEQGPLIWAHALNLEFERYLWEWPERFIGTNEEIEELRQSIYQVIGWLPTDIIPVRIHELKKLSQQASSMISATGNKTSKAAVELIAAIDMVQNVVDDTPKAPLLNLLDELKARH